MRFLREKFHKLQQTINEASNNGVNPTLLAVSKGHTADAVRCLVECGQVHFGENYIQEAVAKIELLSEFDLVWHYIGRVQSNKIKMIAREFDWVHSVASIAHARKLSQARQQYKKPINICVQVKFEQSSPKEGVLEQDLPGLMHEMVCLPFLNVRGLMTMCEASDTFEQRRVIYSALYQSQQALINENIRLDTLSMGMSDDFKVAIDCGSTMVRVGSALFGPRC
jgi:PLP dependent protein